MHYYYMEAPWVKQMKNCSSSVWGRMWFPRERTPVFWLLLHPLLHGTFHSSITALTLRAKDPDQLILSASWSSLSPVSRGGIKSLRGEIACPWSQCYKAEQQNWNPGILTFHSSTIPAHIASLPHTLGKRRVKLCCILKNRC